MVRGRPIERGVWTICSNPSSFLADASPGDRSEYSGWETNNTRQQFCLLLYYAFQKLWEHDFQKWRWLRKNWSSGGFSKSSMLPLNNQFRCSNLSSRRTLAMFFKWQILVSLSSSVDCSDIALLTAFGRTRLSGSFLRSDLMNWIFGRRSVISRLKCLW